MTKPKTDAEKAANKKATSAKKAAPTPATIQAKPKTKTKTSVPVVNAPVETAPIVSAIAVGDHATPMIAHRIDDLSSRIHTVFKSEMARHKIKMLVPQYKILRAVMARGGVTGRQTDLIVLCGSDRSTLSVVIVNLCKRGWLTRALTDTDARAKIVTITDEGKRVFDIADNVMRMIESSMTKIGGGYQNVLPWLTSLTGPVEATPKAIRRGDEAGDSDHDDTKKEKRTIGSVPQRDARTIGELVGATSATTSADLPWSE